MAKKRSRPSGIQTKVADRKARRKEERQSKKKKPRIRADNANGTEASSFEAWTKYHEKERDVHTKKDIADEGIIPKKKKSKSKSKKGSENEKKAIKKKKSTENSSTQGASNHGNFYNNVDSSVAAAIQKDDEEIAMLERSLGISKTKDKKKLNKEYAKLEGYGDDFGDFLDGLDGLIDTVTGGDGDERYNEEDLEGLEYDSDESDPAAARAKYLLQMEQLNGEDFDERGRQIDGEDEESDSEESETMVLMKGPNNDEVSDSDDPKGSDEDDGREIDNDVRHNTSDEEPSDYFKDGGSESEYDSGDDSDASEEQDHDEKDTYRPVIGQDLYGNTIDDGNDQGTKPSKYVPPHLRRKQTQDDDDPKRKEKLRTIQRLLNNNLNRLSDNTLESVARAIAAIYSSGEYSSRDVNEKYWKNILATLAPSHMIMSTLIPLYLACFSGVHFQAGEMAQLGGFIIEKVILGLWGHLEKARNRRAPTGVDDDDPIHSSKEPSNLLMILCYLYNYNVVHCSLMYDVVRQLIKSFKEIDVELLLLILSHCGAQLRQDDPTALKDIVLMVQDRSMEVINNNKDGNGQGISTVTSSRAQFMISAMTDLKNNKRRSKDVAIAEKASHYRRAIGRMKSAMTSTSGRTAEPKSVRITVQDILEIETKGRWWVVGASWKNGMHKSNDSASCTTTSDTIKVAEESRGMSTQDLKKKTNLRQDKLLKLAAKQRMNTDLRRNIFCIIMGSDDCQDAFEKLVRASVLKGKSEREVVRVLVHCCGQEKVYNPYYAHLAKRICSFQNKCKFTFQLVFWDSFKQFEEMKARRAANLGKLLAHLMMNHQLNLNVLKIIETSPDKMSEASVIFLTILFSTIFVTYEDSEDVAKFFRKGEPSKEQLAKRAEEMDDDDLFTGNDRDALKENVSVFLMHYLENSPKNIKKSNFRRNLKTAIKACETDSLDYMM